MSSRFSRMEDQQQQQQQQQQHPFSFDAYVPRSTASTSRMRTGNGMNNQQTSSGVQGGTRSEPLPPRPSYPAPSTIHPDDSASLRLSQTGPDSSSRRAVRQPNVPNYAPPQLRTPSSGYQQGYSSFDGPTSTSSDSRGAPPQRSGPAPPDYKVLPAFYGWITPNNAGDYERLRSFFGRDAPNNGYDSAAPSTARSGNRAPSDMTQSIARGSAISSGGRMSTAAVSQNHAVTPFAGVPLNTSGPQLSQGINIGVPAGTQMHLHYYQVDNRQVHIHNNAPGRAVTNNNQTYATDNSTHMHGNAHAPQANTHTTHSTSAGNTHTALSQHSTGGRPSAYVNSNNGRRQGGRAPSEAMAIRDRQYKSVKKVTFNDWTDRRRVTYENVPNDRPC